MCRFELLPGVVAIAGAVAGCRLDRAVDCDAVEARAGETFTCTMPGHVDRAFDVRVPPGWDGASALPVIVALHGGGGNKLAAERVTCPDGDVDDPRCLGNLAAERGYAIVRPDGVGSRPLRGVRTWNAGGGHDGFVCGFGPACERGIDDVAYIDELLSRLGAAIPVDTTRSYATGISNGGAMSHRLGCELRARFAAIAPVAGANLHADSGGACAVSIPILDLHGTADTRWAYDGGLKDGAYWSGAPETMEGWRVRNGCTEAFVDEPLPNTSDDGITSVRRRWQGCAAATELITITNGGHTWPSGYQYFDEDLVGGITFDFGSEVILDFFDAHQAP